MFGFYGVDIDILILADNIIENNFLRCKIEEYITNLSKYIINDKIYYKCTIPNFFKLSKNSEKNFINDTISKNFKNYFKFKISFRSNHKN